MHNPPVLTDEDFGKLGYFTPLEMRYRGHKAEAESKVEGEHKAEAELQGAKLEVDLRTRFDEKRQLALGKKFIGFVFVEPD